jgi:hypothetical protein
MFELSSWKWSVQGKIIGSRQQKEATGRQKTAPDHQG